MTAIKKKVIKLDGDKKKGDSEKGDKIKGDNAGYRIGSV